MASPRTFKHTPKEEREAARRQAKGKRRRASQEKKAASPTTARTSPMRKPAATATGRGGVRRSQPKQQKSGIGVLPWVLGAVGLLTLILILAIASGGDSQMPAGQRQLQSQSRSGAKHDRMANQRYNELDGKTITEWMSEQDETEMTRQRRERLRDHQKGN